MGELAGTSSLVSLLSVIHPRYWQNLLQNRWVGRIVTAGLRIFLHLSVAKLNRAPSTASVLQVKQDAMIKQPNPIVSLKNGYSDGDESSWGISAEAWGRRGLQAP